MVPYVIKQGDSLSRLAFVRGFEAKNVWSHPANADLAARRRSMDVLLPGDVVQLPEGKPSALQLSHGSVNRYVARVPQVKMAFRLAKAGRPIANAGYRVKGAGAEVEGTTDAGGNLSVEVSIHTREIDIEMKETGVVYRMMIGHLDPHDEPSGAHMRLANLGYLPSDLERHGADALTIAIRSFQRQQGLKPNGTLDNETLAALSNAHGH